MTGSPERAHTPKVRLTEFARGGGCAAKLRLGDLASVLSDLQHAGHLAHATGEDILVATEFSDDAAVVRFDSGGERALAMTADVIAPLVDDPETFGRIAACNALSDIYAMGGRPLYALNLIFFCDDKLPLSVLGDILRGGAQMCAEAGVSIVGGHSVRDPEVKYGLSVTGEVARDRLLSNRTARAGQRLVLSKALGTGIISQAIKLGIASTEERDCAVASMTTLNRDALAVAQQVGVGAATDVTGFGLLGHLRNILRGSQLTAAIDLSRLPLLPGVRDHAAAGRVPGGSKSNLAFLSPWLRAPWFGAHASAQSGAQATDPELLIQIACDAQTSGGLLFAVEPAGADELVAGLRALGLPAADIGVLSPPAEDTPVGTTLLKRVG